jgi:hypothetical protein
MTETKRITMDSDNARWQAMIRLWLSEKKPSMIVMGKNQYKVLRLPGDRIEFEPADSEKLYGSTSF